MSLGFARRLAQVAVLAATCAGCKRHSPADAQPSALRRAPSVAAADSTAVATNSAAPTLTAALLTPPSSRPAVAPLEVPRAARSIVVSSEFNIEVWANAVNTHTLLDDSGRGAVPVSEARFLWGSERLYVHFYAGDLDLEVREKKRDGAVYKDDSVTFAFFTSGGKKRVLSVSPTGVLADGLCPADAANLADPRCDLRWDAHAQVAFDYDGTLNKLGDFDEEWNIELAIPLKSLGISATPGSRIPFTLRRCDMAFDGQRACGAWGTPEQPAELILQ